MPAAKKGKAPKAYKLADRLPQGEILRDTCKKRWILRDVIGQGGFGLIYLATDADSSLDETYVVKIEPKGNGPLFCEMHCYYQLGKKDAIDKFITQHKLKYLGVSPLLGSGNHESMGKSFRFLVLTRYGTDLQRMIQDCGGTLPAHTVFAIGLRLLDDLQYLHENNYVHADVKAANILQGFERGAVVKDKVYLVDYGLAFKYRASGVHTVYKEDPKRAHDGTIDYTSRDAHKGASPSRRGDLEILGYCLLHWICGHLPWEKQLSNPVAVASSKEKYMGDIKSFISTSFPGISNSTTATLFKYFSQIKALGYEDSPDYNQLRDILRTGMVQAGQKNEWTLDFSGSKGKKRQSGEMSSPRKTPAGKSSPAKRAKPSASGSSPRKKAASASSKKKTAKSQASPCPQKSPLASPRRRAVTSSPSSDFPSVLSTPSPRVRKPQTKRSAPGKSTTPKVSTIKGKSTRSPPSKAVPASISAQKQRTKAKPSLKKKTFTMPLKDLPSEGALQTSKPKVTTARRRNRLINGKDASIQTSPGLRKN